MSNMSTLKKIIAGLLMVPMLAFFSVAATAPVAYAQSADTEATEATGATGIRQGLSDARGDDQPGDLFGGTDNIFGRITNTALYLIGALSVLMLIYGGIRYTISAGDAKQVESAKNTIMYAIIGIVVALLAYAIINFVLVQLMSGPAVAAIIT
jgi:hypothetical protein